MHPTTEQQPSPSAKCPRKDGCYCHCSWRREVGTEPLYLPSHPLSSEPEKRPDPPRASYLPFLLLSPPSLPSYCPFSWSLLGAGSQLFGLPVKGYSAVTSLLLDKP